MSTCSFITQGKEGDSSSVLSQSTKREWAQRVNSTKADHHKANVVYSQRTSHIVLQRKEGRKHITFIFH